MGTRIFLIIALTVIMMRIIVLFRDWYSLFLTRRRVKPPLITLLNRLTLIILSFFFWQALIAGGGLRQVDESHFYFAVFGFTLSCLIGSFGNKRSGQAE